MFAFLCTVDGFLKFRCFWKAYQTVLTCQNFSTGKSTKPGKYYQKIIIILTNWPPVATTVPSGTNTIIGALVYCGIHSDVRSRSEQSDNLHRALLPNDQDSDNLHRALLPNDQDSDNLHRALLPNDQDHYR